MLERRNGGTRTRAGGTRSWRSELAALVARTEQPSGCRSTTKFFVKLDVTCRHQDGNEQRQQLQFESSDCDPRGSLGPDHHVPPGFARAIGIYHWADDFVGPSGPVP